MLKQQTRLETIPLASLVITMSEADTVHEFFAHWEIVTGTTVEEALIEPLPSGTTSSDPNLKHSTTDGRYPNSFFDGSSCRAMTFTAKVIHEKGAAEYRTEAQEYLPTLAIFYGWWTNSLNGSFPREGW